MGISAQLSRMARDSRIVKALPIFILALSLCATCGAWYLFNNNSRLNAQSAFTARTSEIVSRIVDQLRDQEQLLASGAALFSVEDHVSRKDWDHFLSVIKPQMAADGIPALDYTEDLTHLTAITHTHSVDQIVVATMEQARDTGLTTVSNSFDMNSLDALRGRPANQSASPGFLILTPVYRQGMPVGDVAGRRSGIQGFLYSPVLMKTFVLCAVDILPTEVGFQIFDGDSSRPESLVYTSVTESAAANRASFSSTESLHYHGRTWTLVFWTLPTFDREYNRSSSLLILLSGMTISMLLWLVTATLLSLGKNASELARRMTARLQESESRFRTMANSAPVHIWINNSAGASIWLNDAHLKFTGRTLEQSLNHGWMEAIHRDDRTRNFDETTRSMNAGLPFTVEYRLRRADGVYRTMLSSGVPRFAEDGHFEGYVGSNVDITEIRLANEAMRQAEEFSRATLNALSANICVLDEWGTILAVNQSWRDFTEECSPASENCGVGINYLAICDAVEGAEHDDAFRMASGIRSVLQREVDFYSQEYSCHSATARRFFSVRVTRFAGSGPARIVVAHQNITARILAEEALREREAQLNASQRHAHVGSFTKFLDSGRILWSEEMYRIQGRDPSLPTISFFALPQGYAGDSLAHLDQAIHHTLQSGEPFDVDLELVRPDGTHRMCIARGELIRDEKNNPVRVQGTYHDVTDLKSLSQELQKSHDLLVSLSKQIPGALYQFRLFPDGRSCFPYVSDAVEGLYEITPEKVREDGSRVFAKIHPEDLNQVNKSIQESARFLQPWRQEHRVILPGSGLRWREGSAVPERLEDGSTLWHGYLTDITERKQLEEELKLPRFTVDNLEEGVHWILPDGRLWDVNGAACRMLGYTHQELTSLSVSDIVPKLHPEDWPGRWAHLKQAGTQRIKTTNRHKDGREIPVEITSHYLNFQGMEYNWAVVRDLTDQVQAEWALATRQRAILDNLPMLAWLKDAEGRFEIVNEAFAEYCGLPINKILGKTIEDVMPLEAARLCRAVNEEAMATRQQTRAEIGFDTPQGRVWFLVQAMPLFDERGRAAGTTGISQDISDRKVYEEQLVRAREAADAASRAQSGFLANMSHEIRTPLNGILGMNQVLLDTRLDPRQRRFAEVMRDSATSLLEVLNDILDWSKIDAGKLVLETVDFDLRALVENITDLFAARAQEKGLEMTCLIAPDVPTALRGDPVRLRQVLLNLLGNAVKFTAEGAVSLGVNVEDDSDRIILRFEISDTGIGISEAQRDLLFRPFSQADSSTTRHFGGTGLGLSIVQRLVQLMKGRVTFESRVGEGSTFSFTATVEAQTGVVRPRPLSLRGHRVLVVDGNAVSRKFVCDLLKFWSCDFEPASDLAEAVARHRASAAMRPFEVIIIDSAAVAIGHGDLISRLARAGLSGPSVVELVPLARTFEPGEAETRVAARVAKPVKQGELGNCLATVLGYGPAPGTPIERRSASSSARSSPARSSPPQQSRLLLVEDNETNQEVALAILETLGYHGIAVAGNGKEALAALAQNDFDLVLMDCQMPEMDGYEASRQIRKPSSAVRNHQVPIIAMTANVLAGDRQKCLDAGMNDHLSKPILRDALAHALDRWVKERRSLETKPTTALECMPLEAKCGAEVFDREGLLDRVMGNTQLAHRVVARFLLDMPQQLLALTAALSSQDSKTARLAAHSIKGAAANVGGVQLRRAAQTLEAIGEAGNFAEADRLLPALTKEWERFRTESEAFLQGGPGAR